MNVVFILVRIFQVIHSLSVNGLKEMELLQIKTYAKVKNLIEKKDAKTHLSMNLIGLIESFLVIRMEIDSFPRGFTLTNGKFSSTFRFGQ